MPARVLTVAFDACEMDLALPWAERGFLPTIGALLGDAASVETRSAPGLFAGAVWPSIMTGLSPEFPVYAWADNKGYSAPEHVEALRRHGPSPYHRQTWRLPFTQGAAGPLEWDGTVGAGDDVLL